MKEKFLSWGTLLCLVVLTCLLLVYALAIFPGVPAIRWFFVTSAVVFGRLDAPAWVQAVGSVLAILAAIGIALWQRLADKEAERSRAYSAAAVIGAAAHSKLTMAMATAQAMLFEFENPTFPTVGERAVFFQTMLAKTQLPNEEQMLLLAPAMPRVAGEMAKGVAAMQRVNLSLDFLAAAKVHSTLTEDVLLERYRGSKANLMIAMECFGNAQALMNKLPPLK